MLDLKMDREGPPPRDAATLLLVRDTPSGIEVFCVERHKKSGFMGGAIVFPGGKLDDADRDAAWSSLAPDDASDEATRALKIAACREALEEAAILPVAGGALAHDELLALRTRIAAGEESLTAFLARKKLTLDLTALHPFARWVTPIAEARRFDTRFFVVSAPPGQHGAHDDHETTSSFWARPRDVLARFDAGQVQLAPPTHRTLEIFAELPTASDVITRAGTLSLEPICPVLVKHTDARGETMALVLPGDPEHAIRDARTPGLSRFVLRGDRFFPENAPGG
jgi:8-oxo-dGTP pyrophosphatase MutT (NUDIX family)